MAKDLAEQAGTAVGQAIDYSSEAGAGFENADKESYAIPRVSILQSGSPQCKKADGAYIQGAEEGQIYNSVTQERFDGEKGIIVIPCHYDRVFLEFGDRDKKDNGFYGAHAPHSDIVLNTPVATEGERIGRQVTPEGHILTDSREHYVLVVKEDGTYSPAIISFTSTQIKASRNWMSKMDSIKMKRADGTLFTPPMYSHTYRLTSVPQQNDQGSWMGWKIELVGMVEDVGLNRAAKEFREAVRSGEVKAKRDGDDDIPF